MSNPSLVRGTLFCTVALFAAACAAPGVPPESPSLARSALNRGGGSMSPALADAAARAQAPAEQQTPASDKASLFRGTGVVVKGIQPGGALPPGPVMQTPGGGVVLNFEGADLREVVRNILGDILNENYTIDPSVGGTVTIRTSTGIPREALPATLETLLRQNGATMIKNGGLYLVVPSAAAVRGNITPQLGNSARALPPGFSVQIVPLRYVGVREMLRLIEPFAKDAQAVRPDELRNLLVLSGTERELKNLMDTIDMFDIDWMAGMSAGLFTLKNSDVKTVMTELEKVLGDRNLSPLTGILRIVPIERMNALLVITPQPAYLEEAKKWVERLDRSSETGGGLQFYVYNLQNTRAERLAPLLQQAFTGRVTQPVAGAAPTLAPGTPAGTIVNPPTFQAQPQVPVANPGGATPGAVAGAVAAGVAAGRAAGAAGDGTGIVRNLQVVADKDNNTLLIIATPAEFSVIEAALKKLDIPSRQVLIEVTIAEVTLTDQLQFGVEWLFKGGAPSGRGAGGLILPPVSSGGTSSGGFNPGAPAAPGVGLGIARGFSYIIQNAAFPGGISAVLNLLDQYGSTKVVANPHIAALDNQKATIKAGNRIPVNQQTLVGGTTNAVTTTSQYIDTGVLLQVTPHINAGGLVTLDVQAEVSNPGVPANVGDAPPINTRSVQTYVGVQSGQTMVMGGLIGDTRSNDSEGLPWISRIPIIGGLFGNQTLKNNRTELVLFITPRVVENSADIAGAIEDLRRKMDNLDRLFPYVRPFPDLVFPPAPVAPTQIPIPQLN
jgi:general secretion pathway protein D